MLLHALHIVVTIRIILFSIHEHRFVVNRDSVSEFLGFQNVLQGFVAVPKISNSVLETTHVYRIK